MATTELEGVFDRVVQALRSGDVDAIREFLPRGETTVSIGTDPDEWWVGADIERAWTAQLQETGGFPVEVSERIVDASGDVGWVAARLTMAAPDGGTLPLRLTAVFRREAESWKLVNSHASFGVPNVEALGQELTT